MKGTLIITMYVVICLAYIFWSDGIIYYLVPDIEQTRVLQSIKGTIFVLVTAGLLGYLIHRHNNKQELTRINLQRALDESRQLSNQLQDAMLAIQTSRDSLEAQSNALKRSNEDLVQFAYVVSHDLQEPLRMVTSYLQLLERRYNDQLDDDAREFIHFAVDGAQRMQAQIQSLLNYSRLNTQGQAFTDVDLNNVLANVLQNLSITLDEKGVDLCIGELHNVRGDPAQLSILFQNLLSNAVKHGITGEGVPRIDIRCSEEEDTYLFCVEDNGPGFEQRYAKRIFEIFQRLSRDGEGTGIGLALCRRIVDRHDGQIWAESQPGVGTRIFFTLPRPQPS